MAYALFVPRGSVSRQGEPVFPSLRQLCSAHDLPAVTANAVRAWREVVIASSASLRPGLVLPPRIRAWPCPGQAAFITMPRARPREGLVPAANRRGSVSSSGQRLHFRRGSRPPLRASPPRHSGVSLGGTDSVHAPHATLAVSDRRRSALAPVVLARNGWYSISFLSHLVVGRTVSARWQPTSSGRCVRLSSHFCPASAHALAARLGARPRHLPSMTGGDGWEVDNLIRGGRLTRGRRLRSLASLARSAQPGTLSVTALACLVAIAGFASGAASAVPAPGSPAAGSLSARSSCPCVLSSCAPAMGLPSGDPLAPCQPPSARIRSTHGTKCSAASSGSHEAPS
jgi:hypothetical protein